MTNRKSACPARKFTLSARKIESMIDAYAAGTEIDFHVVAAPIYRAIERLTCGHKSVQWAVIARFGVESPENEACNRWAVDARCRMVVAAERAIANREVMRREEIARLN